MPTKMNSSYHASLLRRCGNASNLFVGKLLHASIIKNKYYKDVFLGNLVVQMYDKCGDLEQARMQFYLMDVTNVFSWTLMIAAYIQHKDEEEAIELFLQMQLHGIKPDKISFIAILGAFASDAAVAKGKLIHTIIFRSGLEEDVAIKTALLTMYGKCGRLACAESMFNQSPDRDPILWNAMIATYAQYGNCKQACIHFEEMGRCGAVPDRVTFISILSACASQKDLFEGRKMHKLIVNKGLNSDIVVNTALVNMYACCGSLIEAQELFDTMLSRNEVSWNIMISSYSQNGKAKKAIQLFQQMQFTEIMPNKATFVGILNACAQPENLVVGKQIHCLILESGLESDLILANTLVAMYGSCGSLDTAYMIFDRIAKPNLISWNALIAAYSQRGLGKEAVKLFGQIQLQKLLPDKVTFATMLSACSSKDFLMEGMKIYELVVENGLEKDIIVGTALVNMYGKCGYLKDARQIYDQIISKDVILCNAMITAYEQHGKRTEAFEIYKWMLLQHMEPDNFTLVNILCVCAGWALLTNGKHMHAQVIVCGVHSDIAIATALINMYGTSRSLEDAQNVFDRIHEQCVISWNALIAAFSQHGKCIEALHFFQQMQLEAVMPNCISFISLLSACGHAGALDAGSHLFAMISSSFSLTPSLEHYHCIVDYLGRAGLLQEAEDTICEMPFERTAMSWTSLLGSSRVLNDLVCGKKAAGSILSLGCGDASAYTLLSNIYATSHEWHDVHDNGVEV